MTHLWRFVHLLAFTVWIGGMASVIVAAGAYGRLDRRHWGGVAEVQSALYRVLVGPGALLSVASGLLLTFRMYAVMSTRVGAWMGSMQALGVLAALVTLLGAMPAASRLARLEPVGDTTAAFDAGRVRLDRMTLFGGLLALLALGAGALYR
ncbi:MAG TPA: hypothetical protein VFN22_11725 [Gemmatimonadales bacterium]|nr:hypothetical protein [Gemmatimonadales bacterium]